MGSKQLTPGLFESPFGRTGAFKLVNWQYHVWQSVIIKRGIWCNAQGERLGRGDLDLVDLENVAEALPADELFVVLDQLAEYDPRSFADKALCIIAKGTIYVVGGEKDIIRHDPCFEVITREKAKEMILAAQ